MASDDQSNQMYQFGDEVVCKVKEGKIVFRHANDWDAKVNYTIIGGWVTDNDSVEYVLFVPYGDTHLRNAFTLSKRMCQQYNVDEKFIGEAAVYIRISQIIKLNRRYTGMNCSHCGEYYDMAESNQSDGTMICYLCRQNPYR